MLNSTLHADGQLASSHGHARSRLERAFELLRDADGDHLSCLDPNGFPSRRIAPVPCWSLPQYEFRHAWQRELAGVVQLLHAESVKLFQELPRVGSTEREATGRKVLHEVCHHIGFAHATNFGAVDLAAHRDALLLEVFDRRAISSAFPRRPIVACGQPRHAGAPADGDHSDREALRTQLLAQGQEPLRQGERG